MSEAATAVVSARETLTRLGARPFIERLEFVAAGSVARVPGTPLKSRIAGQVEIEA